jgi:NADH-quinone oxidoreductase subunit J
MSVGNVFFCLCSLVALIGAVGTVVSKNPIRSAVALLVSILGIAGLFLQLSAQFLAAIQLIVYAGAVVVLFVFVIMMIGPAVAEPPVLRGMIVKTASVAMLVLLTVLLASSLMPISKPIESLPNCTVAQGAECDQFGGVAAFAKSLFMDALVPFELISVLLTVAVIGSIAVARGRTAEETAAVRKKRDAEEQARLAQEARERAMAAEVSAHGGH